MGFLALLALLCGGALVNKVTWPQAVEAEYIVSDDGHLLSLHGAYHRILCTHTKGAWPFCTPHSILLRWLYMTVW